MRRQLASLRGQWGAGSPQQKAIVVLAIGTLLGAVPFMFFPYEPHIRVFEAAAQVIPVLLLALAVEGRIFRLGRGLRRDDLLVLVVPPVLLALGEVASLVALATDTPSDQALVFVSGSVLGGLTGLVALAILGTSSDYPDIVVQAWPDLHVPKDAAIRPHVITRPPVPVLFIRAYNAGERTVHITGMHLELTDGKHLAVIPDEGSPQRLPPGDKADYLIDTFRIKLVHDKYGPVQRVLLLDPLGDQWGTTVPPMDSLEVREPRPGDFPMPEPEPVDP